MKFRTISRFQYIKRARHRRGHGIHSPFLFRLITAVIEGKRNSPEYRDFKQLKKEALGLIKGSMTPELSNLFAHFSLPVSKSRKLFRKLELPLRYSKAVFRLVQYFQPANILYYGPTLGVNLAVVNMANNKSRLYYIEDNIVYQRFISELNNKSNILEINNITADQILPDKAEFSFINYPFDPIRSRDILQNRIDLHGPDDVVIIRGIHESKEMEAVWMELKLSTEVRVSLDLFEIGIFLFRKGLQKEDFILKF
ncbi:MAG: hypothetical protein WCP85_22385 [Mariniphaga sp.]